MNAQKLKVGQKFRKHLQATRADGSQFDTWAEAIVVQNDGYMAMYEYTSEVKDEVNGNVWQTGCIILQQLDFLIQKDYIKL